MAKYRHFFRKLIRKNFQIAFEIIERVEEPQVFSAIFITKFAYYFCAIRVFDILLLPQFKLIPSGTPLRNIAIDTPQNIVGSLANFTIAIIVIPDELFYF